MGTNPFKTVIVIALALLAVLLLLPRELYRSLLVDNGPITMTLALGMLAIYLLLPRPRRFSPMWGGVAAAGALLVGGLAFLRITSISVEVALFLLFSTIAIISGVLLVTQQNPVYAALSFAMVVLSTCGLFLLQAGPFLMAATIIVYAGAIIVTFLFVIMLAQQTGPSDADQRSREPFLSSFAGFVLLGALLWVLQANYFPRSTAAEGEREDAALATAGISLEGVSERIRRATAEDVTTMKDLARQLGGSDQFFEDVENLTKQTRVQRDQKTIMNQKWDMEAHWEVWETENNVPAARKALKDLARTARVLLRDRQGSLQPRSTRPLSSFSGIPANEPFQRVERDAAGFPKMKADNTAYLGKALFTDYLLAVELAGTLLLVAAVGTIAIASRRPEGLR